MNYLIDSSAWIEYLDGSAIGEKVLKLLEGEDIIFASTLNVAEVVSKVARANGNVKIAYESIVTNAKVVEMSADVAKESGLLHAERRKKIRSFGLVDALILTLARRLGAKVVTKDLHFRGFKEAVFVK